jgi:methanogenic corrinoid protein MtbC1
VRILDLTSSPWQNRPLEIGLVERETGVAKDTLRIWERRYGFPRPIRSGAGRRGYSESDVTKLRLLKRLIDQGYRPKALVCQTVDALRALLDASTARPGGSAPSQSQIRLPSEMLKDSNIGDLSRWIASASETLDVRTFILECVRPLYPQVGEAWADGRLSISCEHLITEQLHAILRQKIALAHYSRSGPRILLTTPPGEKHGLGLLMVQALLACEGVASVSLGPETPAAEIAKCADLIGADIVGLSISGFFGKKAAVRFLQALRALLPAPVDLWVGGAAINGISTPIAGVRFAVDVANEIKAFSRQSRKNTVCEPGQDILRS